MSHSPHSNPSFLSFHHSEQLLMTETFSLLLTHYVILPFPCIYFLLLPLSVTHGMLSFLLMRSWQGLHIRLVPCFGNEAISMWDYIGVMLCLGLGGWRLECGGGEDCLGSWYWWWLRPAIVKFPFWIEKPPWS